MPLAGVDRVGEMSALPGQPPQCTELEWATNHHILCHPRGGEGEEEVMVEMCLSETCEENHIKDCEMLRYPGDHISAYDKTVRIISSTAVGTDQEHF